MADKILGTSLGRLRGPYFFLPLPLFVTAFLLLGVPPPVSSFSQGIQIQNNFGVYCDRPVSQRYPVHADVIRCRGLCFPRRDFRNIYNITVNATTYFTDNIEVTIRGSQRFGFFANIRGFAVFAMTDDEKIVGSFMEQPDALIASCDPLLEGHTAFHAFASPARRSLSLSWSPDFRNYGRIRFRAWIVVHHTEVYVLDSDYIINEITGANQVHLEDNFFGVVLNVLNISRDVVEIVGNNRYHINASTVSTTFKSNNNNISDRSPSRNATTTNAAGVENDTVRVVNSTDDDDSDVNDKDSDNAGDGKTMTILVPMSDGRRMELQIPTFRAFEESFERRLMTVGFDVSADDPFEKVNRVVPEFRDLFPKEPPPPSRSIAPFAPNRRSPFFQSFGGSRSRNNVRNTRGGSSFGGGGFAGQRGNPNQFVNGFQNQFGQQNFPGNTLGFPTGTGFAGQGTNQNQFVNGFQNQFPQQNFPGNTLGFPTSTAAFLRGNTNGQTSTVPFSQLFQNGGTRTTAANPFLTSPAQRPQQQLGFPNVRSLFQQFRQTASNGQFSQNFGQSNPAGSGFFRPGGSGTFGQQFPSSTNPFLRQQTAPGQGSLQGNVFSQQQFPGSGFNQQQQFQNTGNPFFRQSFGSGQQQQQQVFNGGVFTSGQPQFTDSRFGQQLANQLRLINGQLAGGNPFASSGSSLRSPSTFSGNPFVRSNPSSQLSSPANPFQNQFNSFTTGQSPGLNQFRGGTNVNTFVANQRRSGVSSNGAGSLLSFFSNPQLTSQFG